MSTVTDQNTAPVLDQSKPIFASGTLMKAVPDAFEKEDGTTWAYATVETMDRDGDIIRVDGIDLPRNLMDSPLKIAIQHNYKPLPDGSLPVLGAVDRLVKCTAKVKNDEVPALAFRMRWADTKLAKSYKKLYDDGTLDSFSAGFYPYSDYVKPLPGGRFDVQRSSMYEISACIIPVNPYTTIIKAMCEAMDDSTPSAIAMQLTEQRLIDLHKLLDNIATAQREERDRFTKALARFDDLESALEALAAKQAGTQAPPNAQPLKEVEAFMKAIERLASKAR